MPLISPADLDFALQDIGLPMSCGSTTGYGKLKREDVIDPDGQGGITTVRRRVLSVRQGAFPGIDTPDTNVTVDGVLYRVRALLEHSDGMTRVTLA